MIIVDEFILEDYYINGKIIKIPVKYIAFLDTDGDIKNLNGDKYTLTKTNNRVDRYTTKYNSDLAYDIIKVDYLLDCKNRILDPKSLVFLIDNKLFDIFGRLLTPKTTIQVEVEPTPQPQPETQPETQPEPEEEISCEFIKCDFDNDLDDEKGNVSFTAFGNKRFSDSDFVFDGATYLKANRDNFSSDDWTIYLKVKKSKVTDNYESIISFSENGENTLNILVEKYDIYVAANNDVKMIDDIGEGVLDYFEIILTSNGDAWVNGKKSNVNVGKIDLSGANWDFILGGDWNTDKTVNNYFIGNIDRFGVCQKAFTDEDIYEFDWEYEETTSNEETYSSSNLTDEEIESLKHMREEEKLARDVYTTLNEKWDTYPFDKIINAENNHMDAVKSLLEKYNVEDPLEGIENKIGVFKTEKFTELYNSLVEEGSKSLIDGLKVGCTIEDLDIYDLEDESKDIDNTDILDVYKNLTKGSRNHMRAFYSELKDNGGDYEPQYISEEEFDDIVNSDFENEGNGMNYEKGK